MANDNEVEMRWLKSWTKYLPYLKRVYLCHSYDNAAGVEDPFDSGNRHLYTRDFNGEWEQHEWTSAMRYHRLNLGFTISKHAKVTHQDDRDPYNDEDEMLGDDDDWDNC